MAFACLVTWLGDGPLRADDETSSGDRLRILYSSRFTFTGEGDPLVTVEIMGGQSRVELLAKGGLWVLPDGDDGAKVRAADRFVITSAEATPAKVREWTVVAHIAGADAPLAERELATWKARGHLARTFETGSLFAVAGEVMDSRQTLVAIDPLASGRGAEHARAIAKRYNVSTTVHDELVTRPSGQVIAKSGAVEIQNSSVLWFEAADPGATIEVKDVMTGQGGSQLEVARKTQRYFGRIYVAIGKDGKLSVVNAVSSERLLAGLVPAEIFPSAPAAALEAQAVAARTDLLQKIGTRHLADPFLVCATQHCQVYAGAGREHPRTTAAVKATRGEVLLRPKREGAHSALLVDARYSADCGGHGEHNEFIWGGDPDPQLRGRFDGSASAATTAELSAFLATDDDGSYCGASSMARGRHRWEVTFDQATIDRLIAKTLPGVGRVLALEPMTRSHAGRIGVLAVRGSERTVQVAGDLAIRRLLGGLKSTLFEIRTVDSGDGQSRFEVRGAGFGHGVGMCQVGAIGMAENGKGHRKILEHYYRGSRLHRLY